mgnify:CR=1 FL=1
MDLTPIFNAIVALIAVLITAFLIPWIKSRTSAQQRDDIMMWVRIGVAAAEQTFVGYGRGAEKKEYVLRFLKDRGFTVDAEGVTSAIVAMIEAAVLELNRE